MNHVDSTICIRPSTHRYVFHLPAYPSLTVNLTLPASTHKRIQRDISAVSWPALDMLSPRGVVASVVDLVSHGAEGCVNAATRCGRGSKANSLA